MSSIAAHLWLIPALPLVAAGLIAVCRRPRRTLAASLAIGSMVIGFGLAVAAFLATLGGGETAQTFSLSWFELGTGSLRLGWVLDPLTAAMLVMVTFVGSLIFIYSTGYMAHDANFTRFFGFLALFAAAMLGLVIANNLLLLFMCWELVGLASYLLIGFWYHKPSAAAAAKKAFITTRVGDIGFFLGIVWLYAQTGTLLLYDHGQGCLEQTALTRMVGQVTLGGMGVTTAISLLLFCGAVGKSGQLPLHVWLPDAMEGPTPVSALIHAATMVAAGVFLVARIYPLMAAHAPGEPAETTALQVVAWVGVLTAVFAASIAVAQDDIKRILAYSTVSQLGFMMLGLGVGGVAVGMFHLITHAFFKALLFLGAGSVIHGVHEEQDIRHMGGLRRFMPVTFVTYAIGMMALAGVPVFFAGFWSKDAILHAAHGWKVSHVPFYLGVLGALLTAFYMTRQVCHVFFGSYRGATGGHPHDHAPAAAHGNHSKHDHGHDHGHGHGAASGEPHESPAVMTVPLTLLAVCAILLGFLGTPAWPWFQGYLTGEHVHWEPGELLSAEHAPLMLGSALIVALGIGFGWWLYGRRPLANPAAPDTLARRFPGLFGLLREKYRIDELYAGTVIRGHTLWSTACDWFDRWVWGGVVAGVSAATVGLSWVSKVFDEFAVNLGFDEACARVRRGGRFASLFQNGQVQEYLRALGLALALLVLFFAWSNR